MDILKIAVVTGTRAEYGLFYWLFKAVENNPALELCLLVTGTHLSPEFGLTYTEIEEDGFEIAEKIEILMSSDSPIAIAKSAALAVMGCAEAFSRQQPDILLLLGDRYEALAAAQAAMFLRIPIAHLHGGETTEGAIDESIRHAITKMSHLHFTATAAYRQRVIQMGEDPKRVFDVGALGVESIKRTELLTQDELQSSLDFDFTSPYFLVTYHPVTLDPIEHETGIRCLLGVLSEYVDFNLIITYPNADAGGRDLIEFVKALDKCGTQQVLLVKSLGRIRYLSAMKYATAVIGNSSSGIIEAASMGVPAVDIGTRQMGRERASSVIHADVDPDSIRSAIQCAVDLSRDKVEFVNPYDGGQTASRILNALTSADLKVLSRKQFFTADLTGCVE